jgi:tetraacyldisaccharide 4'-kinase
MRAERLMRGAAPRGAADWWLAGALRLAQGPYAVGAWLRDRCFSAGIASVSPEPPGCRVASIGNLTLGGSGKTPLTLALAQELVAEGCRLAVVLRGYGGSAAREGGAHLVIDRDGNAAAELTSPDTLAALSRFGDEALIYALSLEGVAVITARRRADGVALAASSAVRADLVLLDDGFQHRAQARSTDVVILDASLPAAAYSLSPRGYLREPLTAAARATAIATRAPDTTAFLHEAMWLDLTIDGRVPLLAFDREPAGCWDADAWSPGELLPTAVPLDQGALSAPSWWFAGIAHPERFARSLLASGLAELRGGTAFADHEAYDDAAIAQLLRRVERAGAEQLFTTEKDAVRLLGRWPEGAPPLLVLSERVVLREPERWVAHFLADPATRAPVPETRTTHRPASPA